MSASSPAEFDADTQLAAAIRLACVLEASAAKPGNVHPRAAFADLTFEDFVRSAELIAPVLVHAASSGVGRTVFDAIEATRKVVASNTNLGIVLLLAPLAAVSRDRSLQDGIGDVLGRLTRDDAAWVYRAIRLAQPGGLGSTASEDVANEPTGTLLEVMTLAAERDGVAAQYANGFAWVLQEGVPFLASVGSDFEQHWEAAIIELQLRLLAEHPDTLIARKCGWDIATEASHRARHCLRDIEGLPLDSAMRAERLCDFDHWLRADGHRRNPGTTADLVAACLFAAIREGGISTQC
ncbi:MAG: triphosphoribosyl-dephospho-CoA synthase [Planctomycetaceae bacterium]|nr:triphosphoribosyl-dephospho-CoA synthase [Planctomycetaceae bacterium]